MLELFLSAIEYMIKNNDLVKGMDTPRRRALLFCLVMTKEPIQGVVVWSSIILSLKGHKPKRIKAD